MATISVTVEVRDSFRDIFNLEREVKRKIKLQLRRLLMEKEKTELSRGTVDRWLREMREKL